MPEMIPEPRQPVYLMLRMKPPWVFIDEIRRFVESFCACACAVAANRESQLALAVHSSCRTRCRTRTTRRSISSSRWTPTQIAWRSR